MKPTHPKPFEKSWKIIRGTFVVLPRDKNGYVLVRKMRSDPTVAVKKTPVSLTQENKEEKKLSSQPSHIKKDLCFVAILFNTGCKT